MALLACGELSFLLLLPIINSLLNFSNFELYKNTEYAKHPIVNCLLSNLILCLLFIPYLFTKFCCNRKNQDHQKKQKPTLIIKVKNITLFTAVLGFIYEFVNIFHSIFANKFSSQKDFFLNDYIFELFFILIASKIFCKTLIYKHQQVSIILIFLLGIGFYIIDVYNFPYSYELIFLILKQITFSICVVLIKYLTELKNFSLLKMLFIFGIAGLILDLFLLIIVSNIKCTGELNGICSSVKHNYEYKNYLKNYTYDPNVTFLNETEETIEHISEITKIKNISDFKIYYNDSIITINYTETSDDPKYYLDDLQQFFTDNKDSDKKGKDIINLIYLVFTTIDTFLLMIIIQKLSPSYTYFIGILLTIFSKFKDLFYNDEKKLMILIQIVIVFITLFWTLVYNELLELNFCKLNEDTAANKLKRNDNDERRKSEWVISKGNSDADATLVDADSSVRSNDN